MNSLNLSLFVYFLATQSIFSLIGSSFKTYTLTKKQFSVKSKPEIYNQPKDSSNLPIKSIVKLTSLAGFASIFTKAKLSRALSSIDGLVSIELPDLPYEYNSLEPYISEKTLKFHHDKHHAKVNIA